MLAAGQLFLLFTIVASERSVAPVLLQRQQQLHDALNREEAVVHNETNGSAPTGTNTTQEKEAEKQVLKWLKQVLKGATESSIENNVCAADGPADALLRVIESARSPDIMAMDLTNAFISSEVVKILVTTMVTDGTYVEGEGFLATLGENTDVYLELQLDRERSVVNVYQPQMSYRTSDVQSQEAVARGTGDGWLDVLPLSLCPPPLEKNVVVDVSTLVAKMFYTFQLESVINYRILNSQAFPSNLDLTVEYLSVVPVTLGFSLQVLPDVPMLMRAADDRLLYFTSDWTDIGYRFADKKTLPSQAVDRQTSVIWRWDLSKLANRTIRIYVDPTVPERWREWMKQGVEAWNAGFSLLGTPAYIKAILPGEVDWPLDYDLADARYSTISWSISEEISSEGDAKVDPRTGEIIKADIRMGEGWVWAWLQELDLLAPNVTHAQRVALLSRSDTATKRRHGPQLRRRVTRQQSLQRHEPRNVSGDWLGSRQGKVQGMGGISAMLLAAIGPMTEEQLEVLMGEGLRSVIMHEVGHILGLRHNFKGSTAITLKCLQNVTCTAKNSITASVMDYIPMNLPKNNTPVHIFAPTIGAYDRLAIRYGYEGSDSTASETMTMENTETSTELLKGILSEAKEFEVCYDGDVEGEDPYCMTEDLGEDPVAFQEDRIERLAATQQSLHTTFVQVDGPWRHYGDAVNSLLREALYTGMSLIPWIGGIQNHYAHRGAVWNASKAREPVPLALQRRALEALLLLLRPDKAGLLPPAEAMPFVVDGEADEVKSIDLVKASEHLVKMLLRKLISKKKLLQIRKQELLLVQKNVSKPTVLTVGDFLSRMGDSILGGFHLHLGNPKSAVPSTVEMTLQSEYVRHMTQLYLSKELPESLEAQLLLQMRQLRADTRAVEHGLAEVEGESEPVLEAHLALLNRELGAAFCAADESPCLPPRVRETLQSAASPLGFRSTSVLFSLALSAVGFQ